MPREERQDRITLRVSADELRVLREIVAETGLGVSDVVRQAIRTAHADRFKAPATKKRK